MKKIVAAGLLAFCVIAISQQQASAWTHTKFGIGLNFDRQAGGNSALWGIWRNGQPPGPEAFGGGAYGGQQRFAPAPIGMPPQAGFVPQGFVPAPSGFAPQSGFAPAAGFAPAGYAVDPSFGQMNYGNPFQFASYPRPVYYYSMPYSGYGR